VQKIEAEENAARLAQKELEDRLSTELAERITLEESDYAAACLIYSEEQKEIDTSARCRRESEEKDAAEARRIEWEEKKRSVEEELERNAENEIAEEKGVRAAKREQNIELKALHESHKKLRGKWCSAKFRPVLSPNGLRLLAPLPSLFTVSLTVDSKRKVLNVEAVSDVPTLPKGFDEAFGKAVKLDAARFRAELFFDRKIDVEWDDLKVSYTIDKATNELAIVIDKPGGDREWLKKAEIYANYKNGWLSNLLG
jgi:hypothetical protein